MFSKKTYAIFFGATLAISNAVAASEITSQNGSLSDEVCSSSFAEENGPKGAIDRNRTTENVSQSSTSSPLTRGRGREREKCNEAYYIPPPGRERQQHRTSEGTRGCPRSGLASYTLLAPADHIALTTSEYPTFLVHFSDIPKLPVVFSLVESGVAEPVLMEQLDVGRKGIVAVKLPENSPGLAIGKKYRWSVSLICNSNRPSEDIYAEAWVERVGKRASLEEELSKGTSNSSCAAIYAKASIWYDALSCIYDPEELSKVTSDFWRLLTQVKLEKFDSGSGTHSIVNSNLIKN